MAKRKRPILDAEILSRLLDDVHRVPWERPYLAVDALDDWQARFVRLQSHRGYTTACADAIATMSGIVRGLDWPSASAAFLAGCVEATLFAQRGVDRFLPLVGDPDRRTRRTWYTAWWILHCWERGLPPEWLLGLLVIAFEGGPPALAELWRRHHQHPTSTSCTVGALRMLEETGDESTLAQARRVIRKLAWTRVPGTLRDTESRQDLYAELDAATWEVLQERCGAITPLETLFLGLDNRLADLPGVIGNRLRLERLLGQPRGDLEIEIDPRPSPDEVLEMATLLRALEAQAAPATLAALTRPESDEVIASAHGIASKTIQRDRQRARDYTRDYFKRLI